MAEKPQLPFTSRLHIGWVMAKAFTSLTTRLLTAPIRRPFSNAGPPTLFNDVIFAMMRTQLGALDTAQDQYLSKPTDDAYLEFCETAKIPPQSLVLSNGRKAHWIGRKNATKLIVYLHGGGYVLPGNTAQLAMVQSFVDMMNTQGEDVAALFLAYSLAPGDAYPQQLREASELLGLLLAEGRKPSDIVVGGDSAGGNLALSLLSHLLHPHPKVDAITLSEPLRGAFLISPWVSFSSADDSFQHNAESDCFDKHPLHRWSHAFMGTSGAGDAQGDEYSEPRRAPASWWKGMNNIVSQMLIWGGGGEILIDGIKEVAYKMQGAFGDDCQVVISKKEAHEQIILDFIFGQKTKSGSALTVDGWLASKL